MRKTGVCVSLYRPEDFRERDDEIWTRKELLAKLGVPLDHEAWRVAIMDCPLTSDWADAMSDTRVLVSPTLMTCANDYYKAVVMREQ